MTASAASDFSSCNRRRVLVIGLDGATLDLIEPWTASGDLPNLGRLIERGTSGPLLSTFPPATFPAWTSFMTGMNPGKHGILDFTVRIPGTYRVKFVNASHRGAPSLWGMASAAGRRVGVLAVPATYPPEPVNGFLIAGFDCPVATRIDGRFVTPPALWHELKRDWGGFRITDFQEVRTEGDWHERALPLLLQAVRRKGELARSLFARERWDLFMALFGESDTVSHHFWMFHDPRSPRHDPVRARHLGGAIRQVYRALDEEVGRLAELVDEDTVIVVASDHGSGGAGDHAVYLNRWLEGIGWLTFEGGRTRGEPPQTGAVGRLKKLAMAHLPAGAQESLFRLDGGRMASRVESASRLGGIRWPRTRAFSEEMNYAPALWINLAGREPQGIVRPGPEYEKTRDELIEATRTLRNPKTGEPIIRRAWRREEVYSGPYTDRAPDIVLEPELEHGYSYSFLSSRAAGGREPVRRLEAREHAGSKGSSMNGSHRRNGVFILVGGGIRPGRIPGGARIEDVAPTILALLGLPLAADMDGTVLGTGAHETDGSPPPRSGPPARASSQLDYTETEERQIRASLTALGYLDSTREKRGS